MNTGERAEIKDLIREAVEREREACAKLAEQRGAYYEVSEPNTEGPGRVVEYVDFAAAIRARGASMTPATQTAIKKAVAEERKAIVAAIEAEKPHLGQRCGCEECGGAEMAMNIVRARGAP